MKKSAKILSLIIALIMIFAISLPTLAYETDGLFNNVTPNFDPGPPEDEWYVSTVYHWVVRGDTLSGIARAYGTDAWRIIENNWDYFGDLGLRNQTRYSVNADVLGMELENGVLLKIYDLITVQHYVRRGDTLQDFANGKFWWWDFQLFTTVSAIRNENADWFRNLDLLNITQDENVPLMESNNIFAKYRGFVINGTASQWASWTIDGSPLYITVPIEYYYDITWPFIWHNTFSYLRDNSETAPGGFGWGLNALPTTQQIFGNMVPLINPIQTWQVGWTINNPGVPFGPYPVAWQYRIERLWIDGFGEYQPWQNYISLKGN